MNSLVKNTVFFSVFFLYSANIASTQENGTELLIFKNDMCLEINLAASEIVDVRTIRRFSTSAARGFFLVSKTLELSLSSAERNVELSFSAPEWNRGTSTAAFFGNCQFAGSVEGFKRQVDSFECPIVGSETEGISIYHSQPGVKENLRVRCREIEPTFCRMSSVVEMGSVNIPISVLLADNPPPSWRKIDADVRDFISSHVSHLSNC